MMHTALPEDEEFLSFREVDPERQKYISLLTSLSGQEEFVLNEHGIIIDCKLDASITGYNEHEVVNHHISIFYPKEDVDKCFEDLERARRLKLAFVSGLRLKKRNTTFWARMRIQVLNNNDGILTGYKVALKDSTHRAISNIKIQGIRDEYLSVFNNPFVGVFKINALNNQLMLWNSKAAEIMGLGDSERPDFEKFFLEPTDFQHLKKELALNKRVTGFEFRLVQPGSNTPVWCSASCRLISSMDVIEGIIIDITDKKIQLNELERINKKLQVVNSELDRFTYHASHDLRSPITTILGLTNLIRTDKSIDRIMEYNKMIEDHIHHMDALLKDLVTISSNNNSPLHIEEVKLNDVLKRLSEDSARISEKCFITTDIRLAYPFVSDPYRIHTLLLNIVLNSIHHRTDSTLQVPAQLSIVARSTTRGVTIIVEDPHLYIPEHFHHAAFEMFFKSGLNMTGTGLNLYISKTIVRKLHASIGMKSHKSGGTLFTIRIPNMKINSPG